MHLSFVKFVLKLDQFCSLVCHTARLTHADSGEGKATYIGIACESTTHQAILQDPRQCV